MHEFLRSRRSSRRFRDDPVPPEVLKRILETATWAPSAHNRQPWRFVVLETKEARRDLAKAMEEEFLHDLLGDGLSPEDAGKQVFRARQRILGAPAAILLCLDTAAGDSYPDPRRQEAEYMMGVQSVAMAGENLLLAAHAEGLGGVWMCAPLFAPQATCKALNLPSSWRPQGIVLLGFPLGSQEYRPRIPVDEVTVFV